ncbi:helix-turn-helix domain-containing protein [Herbaspirillum robiniae]|uniref:helix-turn-helix domain-containing protein n=1 Tax=Herbaspirillum robiniae TaxID=2014887 RepID=UPI0009A196FB|nr:helix-turn-helix transcriptional regulator [Herbaspirillum robiniae]
MDIQTIGERLKSERNRLGLSQEAFAAVGGVKKLAQISYEQGKTLPDVGFMIALSKIGVDASFVMFGTPTAEAATADEQQLLLGYRRLDIIGKARVLGVIEGATPHGNSAPRNQISIGGDVGHQINGDVHGTVKGPRMGKTTVKKK